MGKTFEYPKIRYITAHYITTHVVKPQAICMLPLFFSANSLKSTFQPRLHAIAPTPKLLNPALIRLPGPEHLMMKSPRTQPLKLERRNPRVIGR